MSEPGAGSDLQGIAATAKWDGDHYMLNGSKTFVTSGIQADIVIVAARDLAGGDREGFGLFAVRARNRGIRAADAS